MSTDRSSLFTGAFAILLVLALAPAGETLAQPVPVTDIENAAGDSVLTVFEDGGFVAYGDAFNGTIPAEGEGTRMMWYPRKAAFRVGNADSEWDDANIGLYSIALGNNVKASGSVSVVLGDRNDATGDESTAMGSLSLASGEHSTAMGKSTTASGDESTAMGDDTEASGNSATAMGDGTKANAPQATAMGFETTASGTDATAMGRRTEANGTHSTAIGDNTIAETDQSLSVGAYNDANTSHDNTLFVVGNGEDTISNPDDRSDALVLDRSGNLTISGSLTQNSDRRLKTQIQPLGTGVLNSLGEVEPVRFQFKDERTHPSGTQLGLIAQEVQAQFPALVSEGASGHLSVSYSKFTAVLLKGLQEQQAQIQKQQAQIERLRDQHTQIAALQAEVEALKDGGTQNAGWGPVTGGLLGLLLLVGGIVGVRRWGTPHAASLLVLAGVGALLLGTAPAAAQTVTIQNGATVSVQNGSVFDLGANTALVEDASSGARLTGGTGVVTATRTLNAPSSTDVAGLGAVLSSSQNLGQTTVTRGHAVQTDNNNESIARYYDIQPGQNNSGLNATLKFAYDDAELNGLSESSLIFFRSEDGGSTYTTAGYDSRDASANTVTLSGIGSLSRWTLGSESQPLPVEMAGFEVIRSEERVRLQWTTASEQQNAGFEVQRRRAGAPTQAWEKIGFVESEASGGTTSEPQSYRFVDGDLPFEAYALTYRLRQIDIDGSATLSSPVVVELGTPEKLTLHSTAPNPVHTQAILRYEVPEQTSVRVELFDVLGRRVTTLVDREETAGRKTTTIDAGGLSNGTYFVRLKAEGTVRTEPITVVR